MAADGGVKAPHVYAAMIAVKRRMSASGLTKSRSAPAAMGGYAFRGIDDLYNALCQVEAEENLLVFPRVVSERTEYQTNDKNKLQTHVHITMEFKFVSSLDGSSDVASAIGEGIDSGDKASGKAQSNAMKFGHLEIYKIPTEGLSEDVESCDEQVGAKAPANVPTKLYASPQPSVEEVEVAGLFKKAATPAEIAVAEARAAKAISEKKIVNGGRDRLLRERASAIARVEGR